MKANSPSPFSPDDEKVIQQFTNSTIPVLIESFTKLRGFGEPAKALSVISTELWTTMDQFTERTGITKSQPQMQVVLYLNILNALVRSVTDAANKAAGCGLVMVKSSRNPNDLDLNLDEMITEMERLHQYLRATGQGAIIKKPL